MTALRSKSWEDCRPPVAQTPAIITLKGMMRAVNEIQGMLEKVATMARQIEKLEVIQFEVDAKQVELRIKQQFFFKTI